MAQLKAGDKAPAFSLEDQQGKAVKLSDFKGRKLLVYFYPKASTPGCTVQSCNVRDARRDFTKKGVLADTEHAMAEAYGVWGEKSMYGKKYFGIIRSSFLIDEKGKIAGAWYTVSPAETVPEAMKVLG